MKTAETSDITITLPPTTPGHSLTREIAERQFKAMAVLRGAVGTTFGTTESGDWLLKAHFLDDDFALAFATYLRSLNPEKCEVSYHDLHKS